MPGFPALQLLQNTQNFEFPIKDKAKAKPQVLTGEGRRR